MVSNEGFKDYAQKWRDLARKVQPPLFERELVNMFLGTLPGPLFNHLIGSSFAGFTELILIGERVEAGIRREDLERFVCIYSCEKTLHWEEGSIYCLFTKESRKN